MSRTSLHLTESGTRERNLSTSSVTSSGLRRHNRAKPLEDCSTCQLDSSSASHHLHHHHHEMSGSHLTSTSLHTPPPSLSRSTRSATSSSRQRVVRDQSNVPVVAPGTGVGSVHYGLDTDRTETKTDIFSDDEELSESPYTITTSSEKTRKSSTKSSKSVSSVSSVDRHSVGVSTLWSAITGGSSGSTSSSSNTSIVSNVTQCNTVWKMCNQIITILITITTISSTVIYRVSRSTLQSAGSRSKDFSCWAISKSKDTFNKFTKSDDNTGGSSSSNNNISSQRSEKEIRLKRDRRRCLPICCLPLLLLLLFVLFWLMYRQSPLPAHNINDTVISSEQLIIDDVMGTESSSDESTSPSVGVWWWWPWSSLWRSESDLMEMMRRSIREELSANPCPCTGPRFSQQDQFWAVNNMELKIRDLRKQSGKLTTELQGMMVSLQRGSVHAALTELREKIDELSGNITTAEQNLTHQSYLRTDIDDMKQRVVVLEATVKGVNETGRMLNNWDLLASVVYVQKELQLLNVELHSIRQATVSDDDGATSTVDIDTAKIEIFRNKLMILLADVGQFVHFHSKRLGLSRHSATGTYVHTLDTGIQTLIQDSSLLLVLVQSREINSDLLQSQSADMRDEYHRLRDGWTRLVGLVSMCSVSDDESVNIAIMDGVNIAGEILLLNLRLGDLISTQPLSDEDTTEMILSLQTDVLTLLLELEEAMTLIPSFSRGDSLTVIFDKMATIDSKLATIKSKLNFRGGRRDISEVVTRLEKSLIDFRQKCRMLQSGAVDKKLSLSDQLTGMMSEIVSLHQLYDELGVLGPGTDDDNSDNKFCGNVGAAVDRLDNDVATLKSDYEKLMSSDGTVGGSLKALSELEKELSLIKIDIRSIVKSMDAVQQRGEDQLVEQLTQKYTRLTQQLDMLKLSAQKSEEFQAWSQDEALKFESLINSVENRVQGLKGDVRNIQMSVEHSSSVHVSNDLIVRMTGLERSVGELGESVIHLEQLYIEEQMNISQLSEQINTAHLHYSELLGETHKLKLDQILILKNEEEPISNSLRMEMSSDLSRIEERLAKNQQTIETLQDLIENRLHQQSISDENSIEHLESDMNKLQLEIRILQMNITMLSTVVMKLGQGESIEISALLTTVDDLSARYQDIKTSLGFLESGGYAADRSSDDNLKIQLDNLKSTFTNYMILKNEQIDDILGSVEMLRRLGGVGQDIGDRGSNLADKLQLELSQLKEDLSLVRTESARSDTVTDVSAELSALKIILSSMSPVEQHEDLDKLKLDLEILREKFDTRGISDDTAGMLLRTGLSKIQDDFVSLRHEMFNKFAGLSTSCPECSTLLSGYGDLVDRVNSCCKPDSYYEAMMMSLLKSSGTTSVGLSGLSEYEVKLLISEALLVYHADQTGRPDYALENQGGSVVSIRCTETYEVGTSAYYLFGIEIMRLSQSPRTAIQAGAIPGQCWAFKGPEGFLVISLAYDIHPTGFTMEHMPRSLSTRNSIDSAPNNFTVWGLLNVDDEFPVFLGEYQFVDSDQHLQYYPMTEELDPQLNHFRYVELIIHSNHGNPVYTCLYRFRVHGNVHTNF